MRLFSLALLFSLSITTACAPGGATSDEGAASNGALSGTIANARKCSIRNAYAAATLADLKAVGYVELAPEVKQAVADLGLLAPGETLMDGVLLARLDVAGIGPMVIVERSTLFDGDVHTRGELYFLDARGTLVLFATERKEGGFEFLEIASTLSYDDAGSPSRGTGAAPLVCAGDAPSAPSAPNTKDGG